jgi:hypothetical protein
MDWVVKLNGITKNDVGLYLVNDLSELLCHADEERRIDFQQPVVKDTFGMVKEMSLLQQAHAAQAVESLLARFSPPPSVRYTKCGFSRCSMPKRANS